MKGHRRQGAGAGFTLIEIMMVAVIIAVAAAVAVPLCFVASELVMRRIPVLGRVL